MNPSHGDFILPSCVIGKYMLFKFSLMRLHAQLLLEIQLKLKHLLQECPGHMAFKQSCLCMRLIRWYAMRMPQDVAHHHVAVAGYNFL